MESFDSSDAEENTSHETELIPIKDKKDEILEACTIVKKKVFTGEEKALLQEGFAFIPEKDSFTLPTTLVSLIKGLPAVQAFLLEKNFESTTRTKYPSASLGDEDCRKLQNLFCEKMNFTSGFPAKYCYKLKKS